MRRCLTLLALPLTVALAYADTSLASKKKGEIGGKVWRSSTEGPRREGAKLDRFGFCTAHSGGSLLKIYVDDLKYVTKSALRCFGTW